MHTHVVGKLFDPTRKIWPPGYRLTYGDGQIQLVMLIERPTQPEVVAVKSGRAEFGLYDDDDEGLAIVCYRFLHHSGGIPWSVAHLVPEAGEPPPNLELLPIDTRATLHLVLVNATGGQVEVVRRLRLNPAFTRALFRAIGKQATIDSSRFDSLLKALHLDQLTPDQIETACWVKCEGGD
jgi:hypothetical protein